LIWQPSGILRRVVTSYLTDVSEVRTASALMMEAVRPSETSVNFYETTRRNISEGCHLHTHFSFPPCVLHVPQSHTSWFGH
jgi:hypothetical protein